MSKSKQKRKANKSILHIIIHILFTIIYVLLVLLAVILSVSSSWANKSFGQLDFNKIIFLLAAPTTGTGHFILDTFIKECIPITILLCLSIFICLYFLGKKEFKLKVSIKKLKINFNFSKLKIKLLATLLIIFISINFSLNKVDFGEWFTKQSTNSDFVQNNYVDPLSKKIKFNQKNNLIYIYLESMEHTFADNGLIPELVKLEKENVSFNQNKGAYVVGNASWTIAAMVAQTSGIPLNTSLDGNIFGGSYDYFLPGASSLGEILEHNGYTNYLMVGSDSEFGGRKKYFEQHGHYQIWDLYSAIANGDMKPEDYVFWGFDDGDLVKYAKRALTNLDKSEPFNFTLLTVDTHHPDGYLKSDCKTPHTDHFMNSISCSSNRIYEFINWIKEQSWYENTTIVVVGDHLSMNESYFASIDPNYERTVYATIINPVIKYNMGDRDFSTYDMFPTTLAAIGAEIEGNKLGLGTNLFSKESTLIERFGVEYANDELLKKSQFYNKKFKNYE